jgi:broad specificity phosphatase PhoE
MLIIVRHGRTASNAARRLQGHVDNPLDEIGRQQARQLAMAIGDVDEVISSPLQRARETAAAFGHPVTTDDRWIEIAYGGLEERPIADVTPDVWQGWSDDPDFSVEGSESYASVHRRVVASAGELIARAADRQIVVVSHVSPIKVAVAWALGLPVTAGWRTHLDTASITRLRPGPRGPVLCSFNETQHLATASG